MSNEESAFSVWDFSFIRVWIRWQLQILMSRSRKLGKKRMQSTYMQRRWKLYRNFTWIQSNRNNNNNTGDSRTVKKRLTPAELDARLKFVVGCVMSTVLTLTTIGVIYALVFVTQPIGAQAENDKMFFSVLSSIATFITGTLAGLMISTGGNKQDKNGNGIPDDEE
jgi:hypothetical protein